MTTPLDSYLHGPYKDDRAFLGRLTSTIEEVIPMFYKETRILHMQDSDTKVTSWSYAIAVEDEDETFEYHESNFSASTHCMILFALDAFDPRPNDRYSLLLGKGFRPHKLSNQNRLGIEKVLIDAKKALVEALKLPGKHLFKSGTYGTDDPFTLTWSTEIAFRWKPQADVTHDEFTQCKARLLKTIHAALERTGILETAGTPRFGEVSGSFLKVRRLHLANAGKRLAEGSSESGPKKWINKNTTRLWKDFDDTIHRQLSYSSIKDQKFDPAELAFAFEGALLLHPTWIGDSTVDQIFEALRLSKDSHPFWRPITPFLANDQGHLLFLISIEVANSILRACEALHQEKGNLIRFSHFEPQLRTYAMWLLEEVEELLNPDSAKANLVGWHTEYEVKRNKIQLWHTSHVLLFLAHYASLLKRKIAADGIVAAGLQVAMPTAIKNFWDNEPLDTVPTYAVFKKISDQYLKPSQRSNGNRDAAKSMLLYGPPGTGKTTVAEQIAASLSRTLLVVTVSDFLAAGAAEIENRAKGVFAILQSQEDIVILFDEIDQFLLDRTSKFYKDQSDTFKFMTPGMLTKLQNLRDAENCIFIIATNYAERIDTAIKRRGRVDEHFLLCLPDEKRRRNLLTGFLKKAFQSDYEKRNESVPENLEDILKTRLQEDIVKNTVLWSFGDLKNLVESNTRTEQLLEIDSIDSLMRALSRAIIEEESGMRLNSYRSRFEEKGTYPFEEFFLLLYQLAEVKKSLSPHDKEVVGLVLDLLLQQSLDLTNDQFDQLLKQQGVKHNKPMCDRLRGYLNDEIEHATARLKRRSS